jgi:hypothetical protein
MHILFTALSPVLFVSGMNFVCTQIPGAIAWPKSKWAEAACAGNDVSGTVSTIANSITVQADPLFKVLFLPHFSFSCATIIGKVEIDIIQGGNQEP